MINIVSIAVYEGQIGKAACSASKGGILAMINGEVLCPDAVLRMAPR